MNTYYYLYQDEYSGETFIVEVEAIDTEEAQIKADFIAEANFEEPVRCFELTEEDADMIGYDVYTEE
jgi:hypothetical protein